MFPNNLNSPCFPLIAVNQSPIIAAPPEGKPHSKAWWSKKELLLIKIHTPDLQTLLSWQLTKTAYTFVTCLTECWLLLGIWGIMKIVISGSLNFCYVCTMIVQYSHHWEGRIDAGMDKDVLLGLCSIKTILYFKVHLLASSEITIKSAMIFPEKYSQNAQKALSVIADIKRGRDLTKCSCRAVSCSSSLPWSFWIILFSGRLLLGGAGLADGMANSAGPAAIVALVATRSLCASLISWISLFMLRSSEVDAGGLVPSRNAWPTGPEIASDDRRRALVFAFSSSDAAISFFNACRIFSVRSVSFPAAFFLSGANVGKPWEKIRKHGKDVIDVSTSPGRTMHELKKKSDGTCSQLQAHPVCQSQSAPKYWSASNIKFTEA